MSIPNGNYPYGKCASWIGGGGIFLGLASISYFGRGFEHLLTLGFVGVLIILNYLAFHSKIINYVLAAISGISSLFILYSLPDFFSTNINNSKIGFYNLCLGLYSAGVFSCQYQCIKLQRR
jgi:hypothetical protein